MGGGFSGKAMNTLPLILWDLPDTRPAVKVITGRSMLLPLAGEVQHVDAGTEIVLEAAVLDQLAPADYELI
jgi:hypothetical protein